MTPERRQVAVLFVDMVGFTAFSQRYGEEAAFSLMRSLARLMEGAVEEQGGMVPAFTGDGVMAVFGAPAALEDASLRACKAALAIHRRLSDEAEALEAQYGVRPRTRIGLNMGMAMFGQVRDGAGAGVTVLGDAVNFAARLQAMAEPGWTFLSEALHRQVRGLVDAIFEGEKPIKGRAGLEKVYRLEGLRSGATRFEASRDRGLTPYVGRDRELETLERRFEAIADGIQVVDIVGEAGIGKSRLIHEFHEQILADRAKVLIGNCTTDGKNTPFSAFIDIARGLFHVAVGDDETRITRKLADGLEKLGLASPENLDLLLNMLGVESLKGALRELDGVLVGLRTRNLLCQITRARSRLTPLVMVFEDLHWVDSASEELLGALVAFPEPLRLLILHSRRPGASPPWAEQPHVARLAMEPLTARETSRLARARLGVEVLPEPLGKLISVKAEGNAFFAEEIASFLLERGHVRRGPDGLEFDPEAVAAALPASMQSLFASRVDRLAPSDRSLLQAAAIIGRRFDPDLALAINGDPDANLDSFERLAALELVHRDATSRDYLFKHALVRDTLVAGLLTEPRVELHRKAAEELERRGANRLFEIAEALAHHFSEARGVEKAFVYLAMAGHKCLNVYAVSEAEQYYRQALEIHETGGARAAPADLARVVVRLLEALMLKSDYRDAARVAARFMPLVKSAGETPDLVTACYYQALALVQNLELRAAHALMVEALAVAERLGDGRARAYALGGLLQCRVRLGLDSLEDAEAMKARLLEESRLHGDNFIRNASYFFVIWDYVYRGMMREARELAVRLIASGEERNDPRAIGFANWILGWLNILAGAPEAALAHADDSLRMAIAPFDRKQGAIIKAVAKVFMGDAEGGLADIEALNAEFERLGVLYNVLEGPRGLALALLGRIAEGVGVIERSIEQRDAIGDHTSATYSRILLAEIYIRILIGGEGASSAVVIKNLRFLIGAKLFGHARATALLRAAAENKQLSENSIIRARVDLDLGLLSLMRGRREAAREYFERARAVARSQGEPAMMKRIDAAAAGLGEARFGMG